MLPIPVRQVRRPRHSLSGPDWRSTPPTISSPTATRLPPSRLCRLCGAQRAVLATDSRRSSAPASSGHPPRPPRHHVPDEVLRRARRRSPRLSHDRLWLRRLCAPPVLAKLRVIWSAETPHPLHARDAPPTMRERQAPAPSSRFKGDLEWPGSRKLAARSRGSLFEALAPPGASHVRTSHGSPGSRGVRRQKRAEFVAYSIGCAKVARRSSRTAAPPPRRSSRSLDRSRIWIRSEDSVLRQRSPRHHGDRRKRAGGRHRCDRQGAP